MGSGYASGYRQADISEEFDAESGKLCWWKTLRGRSTAAGKDHMIYHMLFSSFSKIKGKVSTEMKLVLEQTQQGSSYEVSVSTEGVEELKRKAKINGEKKEALLTLK
nr:hypothetical protein [Tanacetum cinerariifolium]